MYYKHVLRGLRGSFCALCRTPYRMYRSSTIVSVSSVTLLRIFQIVQGYTPGVYGSETIFLTVRPSVRLDAVTQTLKELTCSTHCFPIRFTIDAHAASERNRYLVYITTVDKHTQTIGPRQHPAEATTHDKNKIVSSSSQDSYRFMGSTLSCFFAFSRVDAHNHPRPL